MTRDELLDRLSGIEWNDWEAKEVAHDVPNSAYETVSAFANTAGGYPENPRHPRQAYLLTEAGLRLLENRRARQKDQEKTQ
jgi:hypothetical protein